jgi:YggT family protein
MFILSNFIKSVATVIDILLNLYMWVFIIRALISWVSPDPYNPIVRFLYNITDPVLNRVRRMLPLQFGGIDLSPMIVILVIIFLRSFIVPTLYQLAMQLA